MLYLRLLMVGLGFCAMGASALLAQPAPASPSPSDMPQKTDSADSKAAPPESESPDEGGDTVATDRYLSGLIKIKSARYGNMNGSDLCSPLAIVARKCNGHARCIVKVSDDLCEGEDPPDVLISTLEVTYRCSAIRGLVTKKVVEPFSMTISCDQLLKPQRSPE